MAPPYFSTLGYKQCDFRKKIIKHKMCVSIFSKLLSETFITPRIIQRDITKVYRSSCKTPVILVRFLTKLEFYRHIFEKYSYIKCN